MLLFASTAFLLSSTAISATTTLLPRQAGSPGCGSSLPSGQVPGNHYNIPYDDFVVEQGDRDYIFSIPPNYSTSSPNPIVFSYHGGTRSPEEQMGLDQMNTTEFNTDYIIVYLRGAGGRWEGTPNINPPRDDITYTATVLDDIEQRYCIDTNRVFMTGKSNGGGFTNFAACSEELSVRFAAFAPVSGSFYIAGEKGCDPLTVEIPCTPGRSNVPIIEFHGGADETINYDGDEDQRDSCLPDIMHWITEWAERDGLGSTYYESPLPGSNEAILYQFGCGEDFGLVTHIFEQDVGHSWPSTHNNVDNEIHGDGPASYDATPIIFKFFEDHPLA